MGKAKQECHVCECNMRCHYSPAFDICCCERKVLADYFFSCIFIASTGQMFFASSLQPRVSTSDFFTIALKEPFFSARSKLLHTDVQAPQPMHSFSSTDTLYFAIQSD